MDPTYFKKEEEFVKVRNSIFGTANEQVLYDDAQKMILMLNQLVRNV
jgi:hypothetical protein